MSSTGGIPRKWTIADSAEAYGAKGMRVDRPGDLEGALKHAIASDVTTIVDVRIDPWELAHRTAEFKEFHRF